jgi:hypothetical protein
LKTESAADAYLASGVYLCGGRSSRVQGCPPYLLCHERALASQIS